MARHSSAGSTVNLEWSALWEVLRVESELTDCVGLPAREMRIASDKVSESAQPTDQSDWYIR